MEEKYKVIFLDIDGVLQPYDSEKRFEYRRKFGLESLQQKLTDELGTDYFQYDEYDVAACYCDWDKSAINRIKRILDETGAKIVISSDWRNRKLPNKMKDFLKIWNMEEYWIADNCYYYSVLDKDVSELQKEIDYVKRRKEELNKQYLDNRSVEILHYVNMNDNIINYVAIDDRDLSELPDGHFVKTYNIINDEQTNKVIELLNTPSIKE